MRPVTRPCSTHIWKGGMYESTRSWLLMSAEKVLRVQCVPSTSELSIELAT